MRFKEIKYGAFEKLRGIISDPIQYAVNLPGGDWNGLISSEYEPQKWGWEDSDCCWCLSSVNSVEAQMNLIKRNGGFSEEALAFFDENGYYDSNGMFELSERFIEILSGLTDGGGTSPQAAALMEDYGMIPRSKLGYSTDQASKFMNIVQFDADYFNPGAVTEDMKNLGRKSLSYVGIDYQQIGTPYKTPAPDVIGTAMAQAPLNLGIPVPSQILNWNFQYVKYDGGTVPAHDVMLRSTAEDGSYPILDQYAPWLKTLSPDYYLVFVVQIVVTATPQVAPVEPKPAESRPTITSSIVSILGWIEDFINRHLFPGINPKTT